MEKAKAFLEYTVSQLVENQTAVQIEEKLDDMGVLLTLHLAPEDMGKVIGKNGDTAKAIRTLLRIIGMTEKARVHMKISEPAGGKFNNNEEESE